MCRHTQRGVPGKDGHRICSKWSWNSDSMLRHQWLICIGGICLRVTINFGARGPFSSTDLAITDIGGGAIPKRIISRYGTTVSTRLFSWIKIIVILPPHLNYRHGYSHVYVYVFLNKKWKKYIQVDKKPHSCLYTPSLIPCPDNLICGQIQNIKSYFDPD